MSRELRAGDLLPPRRYRVDAGPMKVFSVLMADPNPIHFDPEFVARIGRGDRPINQGTLNLAYLLNAVIVWLDGPAAVARIRRFACRFGGSVYAGDEVVTGGRVTGVDGHGASMELWLDRSGGQRVLSGTVLIAPARAERGGTGDV